MTSAISVEGLSKAYRIGHKKEIPDTLAAAAKSWVRSPFQNLKGLAGLDTFGPGNEDSQLHWALKDISFEVGHGDVVGIIGHNGAGKSTLLKVLSRITQPTSGRAVIRGRVSSLLEVGTGFHPELSGRENIFMNGTILGMRKAEIDRKFDEIVEFSGVERFLDTPVKRYSSGMKVRLAFAVAAHLEPEILVVDEVLAVGDQEFQNRCVGQMQSVAGSGRTVLFVSHNIAALRNLCKSGIVLEGGKQVAGGTIGDCIETYINSISATQGYETGIRDLADAKRIEGEMGLFRSIRTVCPEKGPSTTFQCGHPMQVALRLGGLGKVSGAQVGIIVRSSMNQRIYNFNTGMVGIAALPEQDEEFEAIATIPRIDLTPGRYFIDLSVAQKGAARLEFIDSAICFDVVGGDYYGSGYAITPTCGVAILPGSWDLNLPGN